MMERAKRYYTLFGYEKLDEAALFVVPEKRDRWLTMMASVVLMVKSESIEIKAVETGSDGKSANIRLEFVLVMFRDGKAVDKKVKTTDNKWVLAGDKKWYFDPPEEGKIDKAPEKPRGPVSK